MLSKELRGLWWKVLVAAAGAVPAVAIVAAYLPPYENSARITGRLTDEAALAQIINAYDGGGVALALLAILLGAGAVSEERDRGTILLLLSKPITRTRVLATKCALSAGVLLLAAVLGHAALVAAAVAKGYPPGLLTSYGVVLSTALMWLGPLSVLGLAVTFSVLSKNTLFSVTATFVTVCISLYALPGYVEFFVPYDLFEKVAPFYSWTSAALYAGEGLAPLNFLACVVLAAALLAAPLWLFRTRAY